MRQPAADRCTVRNCPSRQANISLHSCVFLLQTDALLETVPADRHTSLFTHALASRRQMHCFRNCSQTGRHLSYSCTCHSRTDELLETVPQTGRHLSHSCAFLSHTDALLETVPADRQTALFTHAQPTEDRCTVRNCSADRQTSLFTHVLACRRQKHC